jgi:hypothetical protein
VCVHIYVYAYGACLTFEVSEYFIHQLPEARGLAEDVA